MTAQRPAPPPGPFPQAEGAPGAGATAPGDRGADGYDEIELEFYLDGIGGE